MKLSRIFPYLIFVLMLVSLPLGVSLVNQPIRTVSTNAAPASQMMAYFDPATIESETNQPFTVSVKVDTGASVSGGIFGAITYDSNLLQLVNASSGPFFTNLNIIPVKNKINLSATEKVSGMGTVITITFLPITRGTTTIAFSDNFEVSDKDGEINALTAKPTAINVTINE